MQNEQQSAQISEGSKLPSKTKTADSEILSLEQQFLNEILLQLLFEHDQPNIDRHRKEQEKWIV